MKYELVEEKYIEDIKSVVTVYEHKKTKAKVATIKNDDKNKVFSIAFRTPAINSTGLTHILEHSVLCGSKKYPVKDPFVELLKSSLNTFLNAFTFPDKTMYPCASQNDKDFKNLMDVYLDSVFNPNIYNHKEIFMQEGWHYSLENKDDDIKYTGVVFNEMKGAYSDPDEVLGRKVLNSLFPDNCYQYSSGGDPMQIPNLSYENFLGFHNEYYNPSNSYIFIYGDCDMEERLDYLDKEYLSKYEYNDFNTIIQNQNKFIKPNKLEAYYPISKEETLVDKTYLSYNLALDANLSYKDILALNTIFRILFDEPGALIKQAIIDKKLGNDVECNFDCGIKYPMLSIIVKGSNEENQDELVNTINEEFTKAIQNGINKEEIKAILDFQEFKTREGKYSYPNGIVYAMAMLDTWLYNDFDKFSRLEELKWYDELRKECEVSYYEDLIKKFVIDNNHKSYVSLIPSYTCLDEEANEVKNTLRMYKESLSNDELEALINLNKDLKLYQETPSSKEELDTLPKLSLEDIDKEPEKFNLEIIEDNFKVLYSEYNTNKIGYYKLYFDVTKMDYTLLQYTKLLTNLLTIINTENYSYQTLSKLINSNTGGLQANLVSSKTNSFKNKTMLIISTSYLPSKKVDALKLLKEVLCNTMFNDSKRIYEILCSMKNNMESFISYRGHSVALTRAGSRIDETSYINDITTGIGFLDFLNGLIKNFKSIEKDLISKLEHVYSNVFTKENLVLGFTGDKECLEFATKATNEIYYNLKNNSSLNYNQKFTINKQNEAIKTQYNVNYVAKFGNYLDYSLYNGSFITLSNTINMDYLWMQVRVLGGAYGCSSLASPLGYIGFTSYRDPNIDKTVKVYDNICSFIDGLNPNEDELLKFKIGAIASVIVVRHNSDKGFKAQNDYFNGLDYKTSLSRYKKILECTLDDLKNDKKLYEEAINNSTICVIGNEKAIESSKIKFDVIRTLN